MKNAHNGFVTRTTMIVLLVIGLFFAGAVMLLPKSFSDDLTLIGKGSASVVLTSDNNLVVSQTSMEMLNKIRSDYEGDVHFLVADVGTSKGQGFMRKQQVGVAWLLFFDTDGKRENLLEADASETVVRAVLDKLLSG